MEKIIILAGKGESTNILYHALKHEFNIVAVVVEEPVSQVSFLKRRAKRLGWGKVAGQMAFKIYSKFVLEPQAKSRLIEIRKKHKLNNQEIDSEKIESVQSVNSPECISFLQTINPDLVIVNGTRIIGKRALSCIDAPFINTHAGVTPLYRGVHGGYWALVNKDHVNCGVTVHLVDTGIDTGNIIYQKQITITEKDNFITYPLLQLVAGIPLIKQAICDIFSNKLHIKENPSGESKLWYHPTLWEYLSNKVR